MTRRHQTTAVRRADDRPRQAEDPLQQALLAAHTRHALLPAGPDPARPAVVVLGVSGGLDSVCLAHALHALAARLGIALHVAHVDHGLRPGSAADAEFVARLAQAWGLSCRVVRVEVERRGNQGAEGIEAAARRARYTALCRATRDVTPPGQAPTLAVGHTMDDQAETVLLRMARGSGVAGLSAMRPVTLLHANGEAEHPVRLVRPLLGIRRAALAEYAARHGLTWAEDPTNADLSLARNRVRRVLLPELEQINPGIVATLARTAEVMAGEAGRLARLDAALLHSLTPPDAAPESGVRAVLDLDGLRRLERADQLGALRTALAAAFGDSAAANFADVAGITARLDAPGAVSSGPHPLAGGLAWTLVRARPRWADRAGSAALCLHRTGALPHAPDHPWLEPGQPAVPLAVPSATQVGAWVLHAVAGAAAGTAVLAAATPDLWRAEVAVADETRLLLTTPRPGLRVAPAGMAGRRKTLGDFFTDRKVAPALREGWPLVVDAAGEAVLWVCGLAHTDNAAQAGGQTVTLWWEKAQG